MTLNTLIQFGLLFSIWLIVFSLGARATAENAVFVLRRPQDLARAFAAIFLVVPAFAVLLAAITSVPNEIKFAVVAMSVGPVPPVLPYKQMKAGGDEDYALGLLVAASVASILITPPLVETAAYLLKAHAGVSIAQVARTLLMTIGLPLAAGMVLRAVSKRIGERVSAFAQRAGSLILLAVFAVMVAAAGPEILNLLGDGAVLVIAATIAVGLIAGHLLAGGRHRTALALAAATRHPGVALAIAEMSYPDQRKPITAAILLYLLITLLVSAPYVRWARSQAAEVDARSAGPA